MEKGQRYSSAASAGGSGSDSYCLSAVYVNGWCPLVWYIDTLIYLLIFMARSMFSKLAVLAVSPCVLSISTRTCRAMNALAAMASAPGRSLLLGLVSGSDST